MENQIDVRERLRQFLPSLFLLIDDYKFGWNKINNGLNNKYQQLRLRAQKSKDPLIIEASLYNIIIEAINGKSQAKMLLKFFDNVLYELSIVLTSNDKLLIKKNILDILISFDKNYLNFFGELAVLNQLVKLNVYRLINVEEPVNKNNPGGTAIDFKLLNNITNKEILVEVVNLHLKEENTSSNENITRLLTQKLREKVLKTAAKSKVDFVLVPVMWGNVVEVRRIQVFYRDHGFNLQGVLIPSCFMSYSDANDDITYKFGSIDTLDTSITN